MTRNNVGSNSSQPVAGWQWRSACAVLVLLLASAVSPGARAADAAPKLVTSATPALLKAQLTKINFPFTQPQDGVFLASILDSGVQFAIKNSGTFLALTFAVKAPPGMTLEKINAWNRDQYFSRAYLDTENDPCLEAEFDLEGGVSEDAVGRFLLRYAGSVAAFSEHLSK